VRISNTKNRTEIQNEETVVNFSKATLSAMGILGVLGCASQMQAAQQVEFRLPVAAHWGRTVLEAGSYRLTLPVRSMGESDLYIQGNAKGAYQMPLATEGGKSLAHSYVKLVKVDDTYFVQEYGSKSAGKVFSFRVPKPSVQKESARPAELLTAMVE
jgi:hypothetical protein